MPTAAHSFYAGSSDTKWQSRKDISNNDIETVPPLPKVLFHASGAARHDTGSCSQNSMARVTLWSVACTILGG